MNNKEVQFSTEDAEAFAKFLATLTKEEVVYTVRHLVGGWAILITGY